MSQEETQESHLYYVIPGEIMDDKNITDSEKLLYALLSALANRTGKCFASDSYLEKRRNESGRTIQRGLQRLEELGYISRETLPDKDNPFKKIRFIYIHASFKKSLPIAKNGDIERCSFGVVGSPGVANIVSEEIQIVSEEIHPIVPQPPCAISNPVSSPKTTSQAGPPAETRKVLLNFSSHICLKQEAYDNLCAEHTKPLVDEIISQMEDWICAKGKTYKDYSAAIRMWIKRRKEQASSPPGSNSYQQKPVIDRSLRDKDGNLYTDYSTVCPF